MALIFTGCHPPTRACLYPLQLALDGRLRRLALDRQKTAGLRLGHLGVAVLRRKRSAAWGLWIEETRRWVEQQHLVSTNLLFLGDGFDNWTFVATPVWQLLLLLLFSVAH